MKNITIRKTIAALLSAVMCLALAACGSTATTAPAAAEPAAESAAPAEESGTVYTVGLCNYVDDASLNQIVENIQSRLAEIGEEQGVTFNVLYDNCNADASVMEQIIADFLADKVDLMIGVATPVAMRMQTATEDSGTPLCSPPCLTPFPRVLSSLLKPPARTSPALPTTLTPPPS